MELTVTSIKQPGEEGHYGYGPCVYFEGISRPIPSPWDPNTNSRTRGMVQITAEGEVRWTMYSVYWGEERWKSEGIQIGGRNSRRGVFGFWGDKSVHTFSKRSYSNAGTETIAKKALLVHRHSGSFYSFISCSMFGEGVKVLGIFLQRRDMN